MTPPDPVLHDVGAGAIVAEYPVSSDEEANRRAVALGRALLASGAESLRDAIPGARTLLVSFDPIRLSHEQARDLVASQSAGTAALSGGREVTIAACYGGEFGPDLSELASRAGSTPDEIARRHAAGDYTVAFLGFAPGFAYLSGLEPMLHCPRLSTPRPRVPAGSVAIGGPYTGVYPSPTPGGWRLIARSAARLFDEEADPPAALAPGDRVRFEQVGRERLEALERDLAADAARTDTSPGGRPVFRVVKPGLFTSVQGAPRWRRGDAGVPPGGAMDEAALEAGNARLGNSPSVSSLEMTLLGPELEAVGATVTCVVSGAEFDLKVDEGMAAVDQPFTVAPGHRLRFGARRRGARAYLAVAGGFAVPRTLGSRATSLTSRMGPFDGRALRADDLLVVGSDDTRAVAAGAGLLLPEGGARLRVILGPHDGRFTRDAHKVFASSRYIVTPESNRMGYRLSGPTLELAVRGDILSDATPVGSIQVPASGSPILLMADRATTGGYPKIATVITADLPLAGQLAPGDWIEFLPCTPSDAATALHARLATLKGQDA
jgi:KipI family sensor histidine kinase inhibitor